MSDYEPRHCFIEQGHNPHDWNVDLKDQDLALPDVLHYHCDGSNIERDPWGGEPIKIIGNSAPDVEVPDILDARRAYGNRVINMAEQAAMIRAYLSGREVQAVDVPVIFILVKAHRLGKMPDYADNYDDIDGYLQIAREVVGENMIHAKTADEYQTIKNRGGQADGRRIEGFGNPYRNAP